MRTHIFHDILFCISTSLYFCICPLRCATNLAQSRDAQKRLSGTHKSLRCSHAHFVSVVPKYGTLDIYTTTAIFTFSHYSPTPFTCTTGTLLLRAFDPRTRLSSFFLSLHPHTHHPLLCSLAPSLPPPLGLGSCAKRYSSTHPLGSTMSISESISQVQEQCSA